MVMRADIRLSDYIRFPTIFGSLLAQQTPAGAQGNESPSRNQLAFEAAFQVQSVMHFGKFRSSGAASWATTFEGNFSKIPLPGGGTAP
jgi:hypothetical protein